MKKIALSVLSWACATASYAFEPSLLPTEVSQAFNGGNLNTASVDNATQLNSQSVVELSPSSSMKYPTQNQMFGSQLFKGAFASTAGSTFNSSYQINP